jgi:hypothetical protein
MNKTTYNKVAAILVLAVFISIALMAVEYSPRPEQTTVYVLPTVDEMFVNQNPFSF